MKDRRWRSLLPLTMVALLGACATAPQPRHAPQIILPAPTVPAAPATVKALLPTKPEDVWTRLRQSFAMSDCDADPQILSWARRYTRSPQRFEAHVREVMPRLAYVQQIAAKHDVAGEFALLPWVESHFQPISNRGRHSHQRAAGMWQIMPSTARAIGLKVGHDYDERYDVPAATESVMTLLSRYHNDLHDWRLVDYAYNRGEFAVRRMVQQHGVPTAEPVIPKLPVSRTTREHLTKLLAIACVVREPARFHVTLPSLPTEDRLETVEVKHPMPLSKAAARADMPLSKLRHLNSAYRNGHIATARMPAHLLLPRHHVAQWRDASRQAEDGNLTASVMPQPITLPSLASPDNEPPSQSEAEQSPPLASSTSAAPTRHHTVRPGESLWSIAHHYSISVAKLERWNHLRGHKLKPGQVLKVSAPG